MNKLRLGVEAHEGSIPFTRFRPLVPRGLQRGTARTLHFTLKGESVAP
jgi:hypothetical protein